MYVRWQTFPCGFTWGISVVCELWHLFKHVTCGSFMFIKYLFWINMKILGMSDNISSRLRNKMYHWRQHVFNTLNNLTCTWTEIVLEKLFCRQKWAWDCWADGWVQHSLLYQMSAWQENQVQVYQHLFP